MTAPLDSIGAAGKTRRMARAHRTRTLIEIAEDGIGAPEVRARARWLEPLLGDALRSSAALEIAIGDHLDALARWASGGMALAPAAVDHLDALAAVMGIGATPRNAEASSDAEVVILAARGRLALEEGRDVHIRELAQLGGITVQSARNHSYRGWLRIVDGYVAPEDAAAWLERREQ